MEISAEDLFGDELEAFHGILNHFIVPFLIQPKLVFEEFLKDSVQKSAAANTSCAHRSLFHLQNRLQTRHSV